MTIKFWPVFWLAAILILILAFAVPWWAAILVVLLANFDAYIQWS